MMSSAASAGTSLPAASPQEKRSRRFALPLPREHGAWVMLYVPLLVGLIAARAALPVALLLIFAVTGAFLAQDGLRLLARRRAGRGTLLWFGVYSTVALAGGLPLLLFYGFTDLLILGGIAAVLLAVQAVLLLIPAKKRLDRSQWGELLAVPALTMTAPAAFIVGDGRLSAAAWWSWAVCALFFSSGILNVKMLLASARYRKGMTSAERLRIGRGNLGFHAAVAVTAAVSAFAWPGGTVGMLLAAAFAPAVVRAFYRWAKMDGTLPPLKRVGMQESVVALWFGAFAAAALRLIS